MKNKFHLILALACALCFTTSLSAQDTEKPEKPKAAKKNKAGKAKQSSTMRAFGAAELTDAQKKQLKDLVSAKKEEMSAIRSEMNELVSKEDAKTIKASVRKAMKAGTDKAAAQKAAWTEVGLSAEDQEKLSGLQKKRVAIEEGITSQIVATFSDEQKAAMKSSKKGKGSKEKKGKGKGKGKKKQKDLTSVSVSLPNMTCVGCAQSVQTALATESGFHNLKTDVANNSATFEVAADFDFEAKLNEIAKNSQHVAGWSEN